MPHISLPRNPLTRFFVGLVAIAAGLFFIATLAQAMFYTPDELSISAVIETFIPVQNVAATSSAPVRLIIPSLNVDARVQYVGINKKGEMAVPSNFRDVAWYKYGPIPGNLGSAVINGHTDNGLSLPGVFNRLEELKKGDDVYVLTSDGTKLRFVVEETETYPYEDGPTERIFNDRDGARLNLITCTGTWLSGKRTYTDRIVVFTKYMDTVLQNE